MFNNWFAVCLVVAEDAPLRRDPRCSLSCLFCFGVGWFGGMCFEDADIYMSDIFVTYVLGVCVFEILVCDRPKYLTISVRVVFV